MAKPGNNCHRAVGLSFCDSCLNRALLAVLAPSLGILFKKEKRGQTGKLVFLPPGFVLPALKKPILFPAGSRPVSGSSRITRVLLACPWRRCWQGCALAAATLWGVVCDCRARPPFPGREVEPRNAGITARRSDPALAQA